MIILKDPIPQDQIFFKQTLDDDGTILGAEWWSSDKPDRIKIEIVDIINENQNFKSDITESNYMIYKSDKGEQVALHIQATLSQGIRELMKSPWQRSLHMYESIYDTNPLFMKASEAKVYGISPLSAF